MTLISDIVLKTDQIDHRQKWKQVQNIGNMYKNRWLKQYIATLTPRSKWTPQTRNFKIGDIVVIKSKYVPRNHWPLGQVIELFVRSDDAIRSVKVKTSSSELVRPSNSFCLMEALNKYT